MHEHRKLKSVITPIFFRFFLLCIVSRASSAPTTDAVQTIRLYNNSKDCNGTISRVSNISLYDVEDNSYKSASSYGTWIKSTCHKNISHCNISSKGIHVVLRADKEPLCFDRIFWMTTHRISLERIGDVNMKAKEFYLFPDEDDPPILKLENGKNSAELKKNTTARYYQFSGNYEWQLGLEDGSKLCLKPWSHVAKKGYGFTHGELEFNVKSVRSGCKNGSGGTNWYGYVAVAAAIIILLGMLALLGYMGKHKLPCYRERF